MSFSEILKYSNKNLEELCIKKKIVKNQLHFQACFTELIKFMYIAKESEGVVPLASKTIDSIWHEFILMTRDYQDFCEHYFETFLHHIPSKDFNENTISPIDFAKVYTEKFGEFSTDWNYKFVGGKIYGNTACDCGCSA